MTELSIETIEKSRKAYARVLRAMGSIGAATKAAAAMNQSDTFVSRLKTDKLEDAIKLIYLMGFKLVDSDTVQVGKQELDYLRANTIKLYGYEQENGQIDHISEEEAVYLASARESTKTNAELINELIDSLG